MIYTWLILIGYALAGIGLSASLFLRVHSTLNRAMERPVSKMHWGAFLRFTSLGFLCFLILAPKAQNLYLGLGVFLVSAVLTLVGFLFAQRFL